MGDDLIRAVLSGSLTVMSILLVFVGLLLNIHRNLFGPENTPSQRQWVKVMLFGVLGLIAVSAFLCLVSFASLNGWQLHDLIASTFVILIVAIPVVAIAATLVSLRA